MKVSSCNVPAHKLNAQCHKVVSEHVAAIAVTDDFMTSAKEFINKNGDPSSKLNAVELYSNVDAFFSQLALMYKNNKSSFSKSQQARQVIHQAKHIFQSGADYKWSGLKKSAYERLARQLEMVHREESQLFRDYGINAVEQASNTLLEDQESAERSYVALCVRCLDVVFQSLQESPNVEVKLAYIRAVLTSLRLQNFAEKYLPKIATEISTLPSNAYKDLGMANDYEFEKYIGATFLKSNYALVKTITAANRAGAAVSDQSDGLKKYLKLCGEYLSVKQQKSRSHHFHENAELAKLEADLKERLGDCFASIFTVRPMLTLLETFRDYEVAISRQKVDAQNYLNRGNVAGLSPGRIDEYVELDREIVSISELVDQIIRLDKSLTAWTPTKSQQYLPELQSDLRQIKDDVIVLADDYDNRGTFAEAVSWLIDNADALAKIETEIQKFETRFNETQKHDSVSLKDEELFALFEDQGPPMAANSKENRTKNRKSKKKKKKSTKPAVSQETGVNVPRAPASMPKAAIVVQSQVQPQIQPINVVNINGSPVALRMLTRAYQTHFGAQNAEILTTGSDKSLQDLANNTWHKRIIFGKLHSQKDNLFYHYNKHCCEGVSWDDRITVEQYCTLVSETHAITRDTKQWHRDMIQAILVTPPGIRVKASYAKNTKKIQCHTLYLHDPNQPTRPVPLTKYIYDDVLQEVRSMLA